MGHYYRHQSPWGRRGGRVSDGFLTQMRNALAWTFPTGDFSLSVCPQSGSVPLQRSLHGVLSFFLGAVDATQRRMGSDISSALRVNSCWNNCGWKSFLCRKQPWWAHMLTPVSGPVPICWAGWVPGHAPVRLWDLQPAPPSADSGCSPATALPPGCEMLLYHGHAAVGCDRLKSLFYQLIQKQKIQILWKMYIKNQSILSLLLTRFFSIYSIPSKCERVRIACHDQYITRISHMITACWGLLGFQNE